MRNDNLNITFSIEDYQIRILKFTYECQTWNTPSHSHSSNSYEIHFIPKGKGTLISAQSPYELYPDILYTTGPHIEHQQYSDPDDPTYEYCIYLRIDKLHAKQKNTAGASMMASFLHFGMERTAPICRRRLSRSIGNFPAPVLPPQSCCKLFSCSFSSRSCEIMSLLQMRRSPIFRSL